MTARDRLKLLAGWFACSAVLVYGTTALIGDPEPTVTTVEVEGPTVTSIVTETSIVKVDVTPEACLRLPDSLAEYFDAEADSWNGAAVAELGGSLDALEEATARKQSVLEQRVMPDLEACVQGKPVDLQW